MLLKWNGYINNKILNPSSLMKLLLTAAAMDTENIF